MENIPTIRPEILDLMKRAATEKYKLLASMILFKCQACHQIKPINEAIQIEVQQLPLHPFFNEHRVMMVIDSKFTVICKQCDMMVNHQYPINDTVCVYQLYMSNHLISTVAVSGINDTFKLRLVETVSVEPFSSDKPLKSVTLIFRFRSIIDEQN